MFILTLAVSLFVLLAVKVSQYYIKCWRAPPGPYGFPFIGELLTDVIRNVSSTEKKNKLFFYMKHITGEICQRKYNIGIWSCCHGTQRTTFLHTYDVVHSAMTEYGDIFSGRPQTYFYKKFMSKGVIFTEGESWKNQRRFALKALRNLGLAKAPMEHHIKLETAKLIKLLSKNVQKPINPAPYLTWAVSNVISKLIFGESWKYEDEEFLSHVHSIQDLTRMEGILPILGFMYPKLDEWGILNYFRLSEKTMKANTALFQMISSKVASFHCSETSFIDEPTNLFESYFREGNSVKPFDQSEFIQLCRDLFVAGTDTTSTGLSWLLLYLAIHPTVQEKVYVEISQLFNEQSIESITMSSKNKLPYVSAVIDEMQRHGCVIPLSVDKRVLMPVTFLGYKIEPSDVIFTNLYGIHHDPALWGDDVNEFRPERFLSEDGSTYESSKYLHPFGIGRRQCLGENLAKMELFFFLINIVHNFSIQLSSDYQANLSDILAGEDGIVHSPGYHELILTKR